MDSSVYLFLTSFGFIDGRVAPIVADPTAPVHMETYINPLPTAWC